MAVLYGALGSEIPVQLPVWLGYGLYSVFFYYRYVSISNRNRIMINRPSRYTYALSAIVVMFAIFMPGFIDLIEKLGHRIPQDDILGDYAKALAWAFVLGLSIIMWPVQKRDKSALLVIWCVKIVVTLGVMLFYENNYILDAYTYYAAPNSSNFVWEGFKFGQGTINIFHFSWLHQQLIPNSYHAVKVSLAMVGLLAVYILYRSAALVFSTSNIKILYFLGLFPSILFWSSILGKDPVVLLGIAVYVYGVVLWVRKNNSRGILYLAIGVLIAASIRVWLGLILLVPLSVFILIRLSGAAGKFLFITAAVLLTFFSYSIFQERFKIESMEDIYLTSSTISQGWSHGGSGQKIDTEWTGAVGMVAFLPSAAFTALFRPLPGEILNPFGLLAGLENVFLLWLAFMAAKRFRIRHLRDPLVSWGLLLIVVWASVYGFVSYQNLGSAVRFKLQILPIMLGVFYYIKNSQYQNRKVISRRVSNLKSSPS